MRGYLFGGFGVIALLVGLFWFVVCFDCVLICFVFGMRLLLCLLLPCVGSFSDLRISCMFLRALVCRRLIVTAWSLYFCCA